MPTPTFSDAGRIEHLSSIDAATLQERFIAKQRPVVFGAGIAHWRALAAWTPRYLRDRFPSIEVVDELTRTSMRLDAFSAAIEKGEARWGRVYIIDRYPEILADMSPSPKYFERSWLRGRYLPLGYGLKRRIQHPARPDLLIGGSGSHFPVFHHEHLFCHCFLFQIHGEKRISMFEPDAKESLYPDAKYPNKSTLSPAIPPDPRTYPLFGKATCATGLLSPGDTLFAPAGWWLGLQNPTASLTVRRHYVDRGNWDKFARELVAERKKHANALKAAVDRAVLRVLKAAYTAAER